MGDAPKDKTKSEDHLQEIVRRVVEVAKPERIILFGSAARGQMGPRSDVDLLVIKGGRYKYHRLLEKMYAGLRGVEAAVDIVLVTPEQVKRYRNAHCLVIKPALADGREVYRA
ncbi:MAG: nucleotidyltransferase domain-containing protein [Phycisphaerae bacterium]